MRDVWQSAVSYEAYIGRWSRDVARIFVSELAVAPGSVWLDVGCGSGALTEAILNSAKPSRVVGVDRSIEFVDHSRTVFSGAPADLIVADAGSLPFAHGQIHAAVSGLVLNFVQEPERAVRDMLRCVGPSGLVAVYLWDYADGMQLIRMFWDAAMAFNPAASDLDEAKRFPLCRPEALEHLFIDAGAVDVRVSSITVPTRFRDFDQFWSPFLGGQGPAPTYAMSLRERERSALREQLRKLVRPKADGSIELSAKAWTVRGVRPA